MKEIDPSELELRPLAERESKTDLSIMVDPDSPPPELPVQYRWGTPLRLEVIAEKIRQAKDKDKPVMWAFGAHLIKNGLSPILVRLMEQGYVQHMLTNGAATIHDWEFSYQGATEEDVEKYLGEGQFGLWEETGTNINRALTYGFVHQLGWGESVGKYIHEDGLEEVHVPHPHKDISLFAQAYRLEIPLSVSVNMGEDIFHLHPSTKGAILGDTSLRDVRRFARTTTDLGGGVYLSIGSAIKSPMLFEKALSAARNLARQQGEVVDNFYVVINDLQGSEGWGGLTEPSKDNPTYYKRLFKTFNRVGVKPDHIQMDNRIFLHNLYHLLKD